MSAVTLAQIARAAVEHGLDAEAVAACLFEHGPAATDKHALRDEFAGKVIGGFCSSSEVLESFIRTTDDHIAGMAQRAYEVADAMLKERTAC